MVSTYAYVSIKTAIMNRRNQLVSSPIFNILKNWHVRIIFILLLLLPSSVYTLSTTVFTVRKGSSRYYFLGHFGGSH